ncbi:hypothetical protein JZ751_012646 [Albula glossodonta]|uniref:Uncharacterized protein n=1 Tax=Albula glossodonta TaxID=121402 RepID=A0A8T2NT95_9TELE|nr:hypothetical protein JZ751_012646 [Albula glossodonta]
MYQKESNNAFSFRKKEKKEKEKEENKKEDEKAEEGKENENEKKGWALPFPLPFPLPEKLPFKFPKWPFQAEKEKQEEKKDGPKEVFVINPADSLYYYWLFIIAMPVMYNWTMIIARYTTISVYDMNIIKVLECLFSACFICVSAH